MKSELLRDKSRAGFSLIELLTVIVILLVLGAVVTPAISGVQRSYQLTKAGVLVKDYLQTSRQLAISYNSPVTVSFCKTKDDLGSETFNTLVASRAGKNGQKQTVLRPLRLPSGFSVVNLPNWSTLIDLPVASVALQSSNVECREFEFKPSGGTTLTPSSNWFLTVSYDRQQQIPGRNFITLAVDPVTGRLFSYQP